MVHTSSGKKEWRVPEVKWCTPVEGRRSGGLQRLKLEKLTLKRQGARENKWKRRVE